jgi:hypothetical protein
VNPHDHLFLVAQSARSRSERELKFEVNVRIANLKELVHFTQDRHLALVPATGDVWKQLLLEPHPDMWGCPGSVDLAAAVPFTYADEIKSAEVVEAFQPIILEVPIHTETAPLSFINLYTFYALFS